MKYFGNEEKELKVYKKRKVEYLRCDRCHRKIKENENASIDFEKAKIYFRVTVYHSLFDNDDVDNFTQHFDICKNCIDRFVGEYLLDKNNIDYNIEIETGWFRKCFREYCEDKHYLVEEDGYAK